MNTTQVGRLGFATDGLHAFSPDKGGDKFRFIAIQEAYEILGDFKQRQLYDDGDSDLLISVARRRKERQAEQARELAEEERKQRTMCECLHQGTYSERATFSADEARRCLFADESRFCASSTRLFG